MGDSFLEPGLMAAGGCATGFFWSVAAGDAKLSTGKGWGRALMSCAGSALNSFTLYSLTDHFSDNRDLARGVTLGWFGAQSAAGFTNWLGRRYHWEEKPLFNAFAFPLNFSATPLVSTAGLLWGGLVGEAASGFKAEVHFYGGMLVFNHKLCRFSAMNSGAIGHCFTPQTPDLPQHEKGHEVQTAILGDFGTLGVISSDFLFRAVTLQWKTLGESPGYLTLEPWAEDYAGRPRKPRTSAAFVLPTPVIR